MMQAIDSFCLSSFLAFRYVARPDSEWIPGISPVFPEIVDDQQTMVQTADEILAALTATVMRIPDLPSCGIFLSGGIDSAILAALLPAGTKAYTIDFEAVSGVEESEFAAKYADKNHLDHRVIKVSWDDYLRYEEQLMIHKRAPLHAVEVALFCAAKQALRDGVRRIFVGNGADSTFGGMDKLLSRDWTFDEFIKRYTFIAPNKVLLTPYDIHPIYEPYRFGEMIDFVGFIKKVHGVGIIQAFGNAAGAAGVELVEPFEELKLRGDLDLSRIRAGEPKHQLFEIFRKLYPDLDPPHKIPFTRPMDEWLECYKGPSSACFRRDLEMNCFSGDQKYLIRGLDLFVQLLGEARIWL